LALHSSDPGRLDALRGIDGDVQVIEEGDPRSTFLRYPTTKDIAADTSKSAMKEISEAGLLEAVKKSPGEVEKVFALIVKNDAGEFVKGTRTRMRAKPP
jgi:predicted outer membrane protein